MDKWRSDYCPVCHERIGRSAAPMVSEVILPPGVEVYRPGDTIDASDLQYSTDEQEQQRKAIEEAILESRKRDE